uniref:Uncharacterized protein n=1 Tax=Ascaris lumbricoides TaxID=6252 RepID=A0A0M3I7L0_ASCLU
MIQDTRLVSTFLPPTSTVLTENGAATNYGADFGSIALVFVLSVSAIVLFFCMAGLLCRHISSSTGNSHIVLARLIASHYNITFCLCSSDL